MEIIAIALLAAALFRFGIYGQLELSVWRYGILKAMAAQSRDVNRALQELLREKDDYKVTNGEFKSLEKLYIDNLNRYLVQQGHADSAALRREILENEKFEL